MYTWDYRDRLTDVTSYTSGGSETQHVHYTYDVFNRMIGEQVDSNGDGTYDTTQRYVYDGNNAVLTLDGSGNVISRTLYGPGANQVLATENASGSVSWSLADQVGSVRDVVSSSGTVLDHLVYNSFGMITSQTDSANQPTQTYAGMTADTATGLLYDHARFYDPATGTFISQDPTSFAGGDDNLYRYTGNNPITFIDPSGLITSSDIYAIAEGAIASAGMQLIDVWSLRAAYTNAVNQLPPTIGQVSPFRDALKAAARDNGGALATSQVQDILDSRAADLQSQGAQASAAAAADPSNPELTSAAENLLEKANDAVQTASNFAESTANAPYLSNVSAFNAQAEQIIQEANSAGSSVVDATEAITSLADSPGLRANVSNAAVDADTQLGGVIGTAGLAIGVGLDLYKIANAGEGNYSQATGEAASRWAGALAGARVGAAIGSFLGPEGTVIGAIVGGALGAYEGQNVFDHLLNFLKNPPNPVGGNSTSGLK